MSTPPKATPTTPQWAIEAAKELLTTHTIPIDKLVEGCAAIILKYAPPVSPPPQGPDEATPRTDAVVEFDDFTNNGEPIGVVPVNFARQLEIELAEARAERDALKQHVQMLQMRDIADLDEIRQFHAMCDRIWEALGDERHISHPDSCDVRLIAKLTRLRAVADELAGALEEYWNCDDGVVPKKYWQQAKDGLARYHAATNPADDAAHGQRRVGKCGRLRPLPDSP